MSDAQPSTMTDTPTPPTTTETPSASSPPAPAAAPAGPQVSAEPGRAVFRVENLDFFYGSAQALRGVSMSMAEREITALDRPVRLR